jgi:hypothetical protein
LLCSAGFGLTPVHAATIGFEAESFSSETGDGFDILTDVNALGQQYITTASDSAGGSPTNTVTFDVEFAEAGDYNLYLRLYIPGPDANNPDPNAGNANDSFFVPDTLGTPGGFELVNSLAPDTPDDTYFWLNLTTEPNSNYDAPLYNVASAGTTTFTLGSREDGLRIDAVVFSTEDNLSEAQLIAAVPEPGSLALLLVGGIMGVRRPSAGRVTRRSS